MVFLSAGYWYLTNDARVRREVERYIEGLTGAEVKVSQARFSLFGGIQVENLRIRFSRYDVVPVFEASRVYIMHRPWALLLRGKLVPVKMVCFGGIVRPVLDYHTGKWLFQTNSPASMVHGSFPVFPIYIRDARLEIIELLEGQRLRRPGVQFSASLIPDEHRQFYKVLLQDKEGTIRGRGTIDAKTGKVLITGPIREAGLNKTLPLKYLEWKKRYKLTFSKPWDVSVTIGGADSTAGRNGSDHLAVKLRDVSMELPRQEGGLKFVGVTGEIVFDSVGVEIKSLSGRIAGAETAKFTFSGRYDGYKSDSPFRTHLTASNITLPLGKETVGIWGDAFEMLYEHTDPRGMLDLTTTIRRREHGPVQAEGAIDLKNVSFRLPYFPIRIGEVSGRIVLKPGKLELNDLRGRYGQSAVRISGDISGPIAHPAYDVEISIRDLPLANEVRDALPEHSREVWKELSPRGVANLTIHAVRKSQADKPAVTITIDMDGRASFEYAGFPYRLDGVDGQVVITPQEASLKSLRASAGPMRCVFSGTICRRKGCRDFRIEISSVSDLPLDEKLSNALPKSVQDAFRSCGLTGMAEITDGAVWRKGNGPTKVDIPMVIKSASIRHEQFPYKLDRVNGLVKVTQEGLIIRHLVGWHGNANVGITGEVLFLADHRKVALDIEGTNISLDSSLYNAIPSDAKRAWDMLDPAGRTNLALALQWVIPVRGKEGGKGSMSSYRLVVRPHGARFRYKDFPYTFRDVSGKVIFTAGKVTLESVKASAGGGKVDIQGIISTKKDQERADLTIQTGWVRLDKRLLSALPTGMVDAFQMRPGGKVALSLKHLRVRRADNSPRRVNTRPSKNVLAWSWSGKVSFDKVAMDFPTRLRQLTGWIEGEMDCKGLPEALTTDARVFLERATVGEHQLEDVSCRLEKPTDSTLLRIRSVSAKAFGGRVEGFAEVNLSTPGKYGVSLSVEDVNIAKFFKTGARVPPHHRDVKGSLAGNIQMTMTIGDRSSRRAVGRLHISRARIYRLPVLLWWLKVIYLSLPGDSAFHTGEVRYFLRGDTLIFREIYLQGSAISLLGAGTMDMNSQKLNLTFLTGPPRKLPRLSALSEVIEGISSQLMTVRISGTLTKPHVKTQALRNLDKTLRELVDPGGSK